MPDSRPVSAGMSRRLLRPAPGASARVAARRPMAAVNAVAMTMANSEGNRRAKIWLTDRVIASLVYASSRQSEGPPISYPPTTNAVAAGTAITSQSLHRRAPAEGFWRLARTRSTADRAAAEEADAEAGPRDSGAATAAVGAVAPAGSSGPMSVSDTAVPSQGAGSRPDGTLEPRLSKARPLNRTMRCLYLLATWGPPVIVRRTALIEAVAHDDAGPSTRGGSADEEAVADAGRRLAVVQRGEPGRETLVGVAVGGGDRIDVLDGLDHPGRAVQHRTRGFRFEVEIEAAQAVAVFGQVIGEEHHRAAGHRVVEHGRGVVGNQDVGDQEELGDIGVGGDVDREAGPHPGRHVIGHVMVPADEEHVVLAEFPPGPFQVQAHIEPVPAAVRVHLVIPPGGRVENDPLPVRQPEPGPHPRGHFRGVGPAEQVVARVPVLADLPVVGERAAHDRCAERVRREQQDTLCDVCGQVIEIGRPADELRVGDVEPDPLQRGAVPGLQVELAVALTERRLHVVVGDQVPRPG